MLSAYKGQPEILDDVHVPDYTPEEYLPSDDPANMGWWTKELIPETMEEVQGFVGSVQPLTQRLYQTEKDSIESTLQFAEIQNLYVDEILKKPKSRWSQFLNRMVIPKDYLYFGNNEFKAILPLMCEENPFFASALIAEYDTDGTPYFALKAFAPPGEPTPESKFYQLMKEDPNVSHRINVRFNADMSLNRITAFDAAGKPRVVPESDWNEYAAGATYNLMYYSSSMHATIHVLHFLMTTGIKYCTRHDDALSAWASPYDDNVANKYNQVSQLLIAGDFRESEGQLITGAMGLVVGQSPASVKPLLREMLCTMGQCKTAKNFVRDFLLKDLYASCKNQVDFEDLIEKGSILSEFNEQIGLVGPFAKDLASALKANDVKGFDFCEASLADFMKETGKGVSSINTVDSWVQLMSATGLVHTATMSMSRLIAMPEFLRWRHTNKDTWDFGDLSCLTSILGTICGTTAGRHVFTDKIDKDSKSWDMTDIPTNVKAILRKYDRTQYKLAKSCMRATSKRPDFKEYGWILTDWFPELVDGKQRTFTTYV